MSSMNEVLPGCYGHILFLLCSQKLHEGVVRDLERQQKSKIQNLKMLQDQIELTKVLKARRDADMEEEMSKEKYAYFKLK